MHLLIVEDDVELGAALQKALAGHGFTSQWVRRVADAMAFGRFGDYACILLDLGLPDGDGLAALRAWRETGLDSAVIVLTARDGLDDRVAGLDSGADDYVLKPVEMKELVSRIHAVTRRAGGHKSTQWQIGRVRIDTRLRHVQLDGMAVELSPMEFTILHELARRAGQVVPKHRIAGAVHPLGDPLESNTLEVHIYNLRRKLGRDTIRTVRGVGYSIAA